MLTNNTQSKKIESVYVGDGPWTHFDEIFTDKDDIYISKDILYGGRRNQFQDLVDKFRTSLQSLANSFIFDYSHIFQSKDEMWNMFMLPISTMGSNKAISDLFKSYALNSLLNLTNLYKYGISKCLFVSLYHDQTYSNKSKDNQEQSP